MITGRGPVNFAGGRYRTPKNSRPSKLFHFTISGSGRISGLKTPDSLFVHRSTAPVAAFTEKTSPYMAGDQNENATSELSGFHDGRLRSCPLGSFGIERTPIVRASRSSSRLPFGANTTTASVRPSGESDALSIISSGLPSGFHSPDARSHLQTRLSSESLLLSA